MRPIRDRCRGGARPLTLRLLLVNSHGADQTMGGTEGYVAKLASGFRDRGYEVFLLGAFPGASPLPPERTRYLHNTDWRESQVRRWRNHVDDLISRPSSDLAAGVAWAAPDIVHTHNLPGITTGIWEVARRAGAAVVHTLHDYHLLCPRVTLLRPDGELCRPHPLLCGMRTRSLARWGDAVAHVVGVSQYLLDQHAHIFRQARQEVLRHPMTPPTSRTLRPPRERLETIGYIGALARTKGIDRLLAALPAIVELGCNLRIAGEGRMHDEVAAAAASFPQLRYDGFVAGAAKEEFLEECDVGILPSVWPEPGGPPWAMLDWLWAGRPVLVSPRGGLAEALDELPGALPVEPTAQGIAAAIERLVEPGPWHDALHSLRPMTNGSDLDRWFDTQERVYRDARGDARR